MRCGSDCKATAITVTDLHALAVDAIRRSGMLQGGETVLTAVSGGADSVALLEVLRSLASEWRLTLHAVHVHHGLRPQADADADFVRGLCAQIGVPFHVEDSARPRDPGWNADGHPLVPVTTDEIASFVPQATRFMVF